MCVWKVVSHLVRFSCLRIVCPVMPQAAPCDWPGSILYSFPWWLHFPTLLLRHQGQCNCAYMVCDFYHDHLYTSDCCLSQVSKPSEPEVQLKPPTLFSRQNFQVNQVITLFFILQTFSWLFFRMAGSRRSQRTPALKVLSVDEIRALSPQFTPCQLSY